jgi:hypothetical protein
MTEGTPTVNYGEMIINRFGTEGFFPQDTTSLVFWNLY